MYQQGQRYTTDSETRLRCTECYQLLNIDSTHVLLAFLHTFQHIGVLILTGNRHGGCGDSWNREVDLVVVNIKGRRRKMLVDENEKLGLPGVEGLNIL